MGAFLPNEPRIRPAACEHERAQLAAVCNQRGDDVDPVAGTTQRRAAAQVGGRSMLHEVRPLRVGETGLGEAANVKPVQPQPVLRPQVGAAVQDRGGHRVNRSRAQHGVEHERQAPVELRVALLAPVVIPRRARVIGSDAAGRGCRR